jgi:hypothetical protein
MPRIPKNPETWGVLITLLAMLCGGIFWLSEMHLLAKQNKEEIHRIEDNIHEVHDDASRELKEQSRDINEAKEKLASISAKMDILIQIVKENTKRTDSNMRER